MLSGGPSTFGSLYAKSQRQIFFFGRRKEFPSCKGLSTLSTEFSTMCYVNETSASFCIFL